MVSFTNVKVFAFGSAVISFNLIFFIFLDSNSSLNFSHNLETQTVDKECPSLTISIIMMTKSIKMKPNCFLFDRNICCVTIIGKF